MMSFTFLSGVPAVTRHLSKEHFGTDEFLDTSQMSEESHPAAPLNLGSSSGLWAQHCS